MSQKQSIHSREYTNQAIVMRTIGTGAFMGIAFYLIWTLIQTFNFTPYPVHYYIQKSMMLVFDIPKWFELIVLAITMSIISIVVALVYYVLAKKWMSMWIGMIYGALLAALHIFIIHPLFIGETLLYHSYASTITIFSMHVLYGVSIGYSIAFDYTESMAHRENENEHEHMM